MKTKTKLIPYPRLLKKAESVFNRWIREYRDVDELCIACGKHHDCYDAGHYVPVKNGSFLRFNEWNVNKEGKSCNGFDSFHLIGYRKRLIEKIGIENVEWLEENRHTVHKYSRTELELLIQKYKL